MHGTQRFDIVILQALLILLVSAPGASGQDHVTRGSCLIQNTKLTERVRLPRAAAEDAQVEVSPALPGASASQVLADAVSDSAPMPVSNSSVGVAPSNELVRDTPSSLLLALSLCTELLQQIWFWIASIFLVTLFIATTCIEVLHPTAGNRPLTKAELQAPYAKVPAPARISADMIAEATTNEAG
mmetsp:Transcript_19066/g.44476  ORF Transcript_19066/g.44476 Transcript_19066/m.44476 type:complete len:185 (+) Transcript_19066:110-664(+)